MYFLCIALYAVCWIIVLQKSEREKPHSGKTKSHSPTKTPCNQPAIAILTHAQTQHKRSTNLA